MSMTHVQRQTFEDRLNRIQVGGENTNGEIHAGPREQVRAKDRRKTPAKSRRVKTRQLKKAQEPGAGPNAIMMPLAMFLGALSVAAGRLTEFHLFADEGLGQMTPPMPELAVFGQYLFGGVLAVLFMWAFELDSALRRIALLLGFVTMVIYEPLVIERFPDIYATFYSPDYVSEQLG